MPITAAVACRVLASQFTHRTLFNNVLAKQGVAASLDEPLQCRAVAKTPDQLRNDIDYLFAAATTHISLFAAASANQSGHDST